MIYSGFQGIDPNKVKLAQTSAPASARSSPKSYCRERATLIATLKVNAGLSLVGVVVGEFPVRQLGARLPHPVRQPNLQMNIVMTAITMLAIVSSLMYLAISGLEAAVMRAALGTSEEINEQVARPLFCNFD